MKKVVVCIVSLAISLISFSQSEFETAMLVNIDSLHQSFGTGRMLGHVNTFERFSQVDTNRWEPLYYAAYGYCVLSLNEKDDSKKDILCDRGQELLKKALAKSPNESELYVLQGFLYNMRLLVNPMMRGQQYMGLINASYDKAEKLDSLNPRVYYMRANITMNLPPFMGGGKDKALPIFQKAKQKFDTFTSTNVLAPRWGSEDCSRKLEECRK